MLEKIKNFIVGLFYQNDVPFLPNVIAILFALTFLFVSLYLVLSHSQWANYDTFSNVSVLGGAGSSVGSHIVNSLWNSPKGEPPK